MTTAKPANIVAAIVNYRTADLTIDCLRSLEGELRRVPEKIHVVVADADSGDGSADKIDLAIKENHWQDWCELRRLPRNGGFAYANNAVIRQALAEDAPPEFIYLLNPDTVVRPGAIVSLIAILRDRPDTGIVGSRLEDPDGTVQRSAFRFPSIWSELDSSAQIGLISRLLRGYMIAPEPPKEICQADWVAGASMLIRREVFDSIGLLDEDYFMYFEEVDFCRRAAAAGWRCCYAPESRVVHLVGQSSGINTAVAAPRRCPRYVYESKYLYWRKNHGRMIALIAHLCWFAGYGTSRLRKFIIGRTSRITHEGVDTFRWVLWPLLTRS
jgi:N-acetylglucosaminyl-diphospho-decaprenol L-rhamnosyltransferase